MDDMWFVYSGAAVVVLSVVALLTVGKPEIKVWNDLPAVMVGLVSAVLAYLLAVASGVDQSYAWGGALLWCAGVGHGAHIVRARMKGRPIHPRH